MVIRVKKMKTKQISRPVISLLYVDSRDILTTSSLSTGSPITSGQNVSGDAPARVFGSDAHGSSAPATIWE